jgi:hypothetical protein
LRVPDLKITSSYKQGICALLYCTRSDGHRSLPELQRGHRGGQIIHVFITSAANIV